MVGSAIARSLRKHGFSRIIGHSSTDLDLTDQRTVIDFFQRERPEYVFLAAAKVGGIYANNAYPAEFIRQNLEIQGNVIHNAYLTNAKKLIFLGSSCIYPKLSQQPIKEEYLLSGQLEPTNEAYSIAKIAGLKMCEFYNRQYGTNFISAMPTNLYGPGDNYTPMNSHVLPALIRRFHEAKIAKAGHVTIWGTGAPLREFLHVDDLAEACLFLMLNYSETSPVNVGSGEEVSILELAELISNVVEFQGKIEFDATKPDGTPRKLLDSSRINQLGWKSKISLDAGIRRTYSDILKQPGLWEKPT